MQTHTHKEIEKSVIRSQHTQRNWDLSKQIPKEDINTMLHAITNCPSKQNIAFSLVNVLTADLTSDIVLIPVDTINGTLVLAAALRIS